MKSKETPFNVDAHIALWAKAVDVQQHFNDISWRIRALGVTILTFTFGATGVAYAQAEQIHFWEWSFSPAAFIPLVGVVLWWALWFTDAHWYHRLLVGAVKEGAFQERLLTEHGVRVRLGGFISDESPIKFYRHQSAKDKREKREKIQRRFRGRPAQLNSKHKLSVYYGVIAVLLFVIFFSIAIYGIALSQPPATAPMPTKTTMQPAT